MRAIVPREAHSLLLRTIVGRTGLNASSAPVVDRDRTETAAFQAALLPALPPRTASLDLAVHYQPVRGAGGDYYDLFSLPDGRWGILLADVSGHGTSAALLMAITHAIAHMYPGPGTTPGGLLDFVNRHLTTRYTRSSGAFVTAFYGIYDPGTRELSYARAGHLPPRIRNCHDGRFLVLAGDSGLPLGILPEEHYPDNKVVLRPCDQLILYTDGITEAESPGGERFGAGRIDRLLRRCHRDANALLATLLRSLGQFTDGRPLADDRTVLIARIA